MMITLTCGAAHQTVGALGPAHRDPEHRPGPTPSTPQSSRWSSCVTPPMVSMFTPLPARSGPSCVVPAA